MSSQDIFLVSAVRCCDLDCRFRGTVVETNAGVGDECWWCGERGGGGIWGDSNGGAGDGSGVLCAMVIAVSPPLAGETEVAVAVRVVELIAAVSCGG